jgi:integrase/recombinase XerC
MMIADFLKYLLFEKRVSTHTHLAYQTDLYQFQSFIGKNSLEVEPHEADFTTVRTWIISLVESGVEPVSVNRKISSLRAFFKYLLRQEVIKKDPMMKVRVLKTSKKLPSFIKEGEISSLLDAPLVAFGNDFEGVRNKLIIELFYATGIRLSELIGLKDNCIDLTNRTIKVLGKRNKERIIPFHKSLVSLIKEYKTLRSKDVKAIEHGCFFVTISGEPCYPMMVQRLIKKYLSENTGVEKRSPHVLRHTFATHLLDKGAEINAVKDLLGHSSLAATQVYTHNSMEKLKKAFDQAHPKA